MSTSTLTKRWNPFKKLAKVFARAVAFVAKALPVIAKAVAPFLPACVAHALTAAANIASNILNVYASLLNAVATGKLTQALHLGLGLQPPRSMLDDSPWGNQVKIYEWNPPNAYGSAGLVPSWDNDGYKGVLLYCVNCGINGNIAMTGTLGANIRSGLTSAAIDVHGNMYAGLYMGLYAKAKYEKEFSLELLSVGLPGLSIPDVVTIGPELKLDISTTIGVSAMGQALAGGSLTWPAITAHLDLINSRNSYQSGFRPNIDHKFELDEEIEVSISLGTPVSLGIGVDILKGKWEKDASVSLMHGICFGHEELTSSSLRTLQQSS